MLAADHLHCARGKRTVLSDVSLALPAGEVLGVLGANGAGKISLLATLAGYPFPDMTPSSLDALVERALSLADVRGLIDRRYGTLSGGEQQRVQFARTLVQLLAGRPDGEYRVLFLDEPTASLDPRNQIALLQAVSALAREAGVAVLVVLHDVNLAAAWCDRLLLLAQGREVTQGAPAEILTPATLQAVYGLPARVMAHPDVPGQPLVLFSREPA